MDKFAIEMEPIKAYSITHLLIVVLIFSACFISASLLYKIKASKKLIILVSGLILIALEFIKEPLLTYVRGGCYSWSDFPFQLCSTPMYLCIIYFFLKPLKPHIENFLSTFGLIGAIAAFAIPYSSFYHYILLTMQSLVWHGILLFLAIYLIFDKRNAPEIKFHGAALIYLVASIIAIILNISLFDISKGSCNMFFFGPGNPDVGVLNFIEDKAGWIIETILMIIATESAAFFVNKLETYKPNKLNK